MTDKAETTPAQMRLLRFCAEFPKWHSLVELDQIRLLETDDVLVVPSLIKQRLLDHHVGLQAVRITAAGQVIATEGSDAR